MSSRAMSAAGIAPEELNPNCPKEVMNMKVRLTSPGEQLTRRGSTNRTSTVLSAHSFMAIVLTLLQSKLAVS